MRAAKPGAVLDGRRHRAACALGVWSLRPRLYRTATDGGPAMGCDGRESGSRRVGRRRVGGCFAAVAALALCVCGPAWAVAPLAPAGESGVLAPRAPIAARSAPGRVPHAKHRAQSALPLHLPLPLLAVPTPGGTWSPLGPAAIGPSYNFGGGFYGGENSGRITGLASLP